MSRTSEARKEVRETRKAIIAGAFGGERISLSRIRSQVEQGYYTKAMFMEKTDLTENEFRALKASGKLTPVAYSTQGWALYDEATIEKLRDAGLSLSRQRKMASLSRKNWSSYTPYEGVAVFKHIEKGTPLTKVVTELNLHPSLINAIREDYALLNRGVVVHRDIMDKVNRLEGKIDGVFPIQSGEDLLRLIERLITKSTCVACHDQPRKYCVRCARERFAVRIEPPDDPLERINEEVLDPERTDEGEGLTRSVVRYVETNPGTTAREIGQRFGESGIALIPRLAKRGTLRRAKGEADGIYHYWVS